MSWKIKGMIRRIKSRKINGKKTNRVFFYDSEKMTLSDRKGNIIKVDERLDNISDNNLEIFVTELFEKIYNIQSEYSEIWESIKRDRIEWSEF